jgi:carbamoyl-phosphate synthase small subunit
LLALAAGGKTLKMKFGHHGANHPVKDLETGQVLITSQNHGFAVDPATLAGQRQGDPRLAVRRQPAGHGLDRPPGLLLPGPPRSQPGSARRRLPVRPLHRDDEANTGSLPHEGGAHRHPPS